MEYSQEKMLAVLKDKYDGYHFSDALVDVYNPFSLLNAFDREKINNYWFDSGISTTLVQAFKQYVGDFQEELNLIEDKTWMNQSQFTHSLEDHASIIPLLYQTGYLTIKEYNKKENLYLLDYPNAEVRVGLLKNLLPLYSSANADAAVNSASRASTALREGNIETAMNNLRSLLKSIPYGKNEPKILQSTEDTEEYYQKFFFLYFRMMYDLVHAEVRNSSGATDVTITTPDYIYVVELKINTAPEIALKQIDEKEYAVPYLEGRRAVYKVGVNFSTETRTISEWKVVEAKGITK
jgi:flagellin-specific chaperone FliS